MGVEVAETVNESKVPLSDGKPEIKFGSHGEEAEPLKVEKIKASDSHLPKDAVDEWPEPKQIHSFYVVRLRSLEDQNLKTKLELADRELQKKNQARSQVIEKLKAKRAERSQIIVQLKSLGSENKQFRSIIDEKRKEMEPLQQALGKLRSGSSGGGGRDRGSSGICSSEEELNDVIKSLQYRIQHESIPLSEEKQILREIKQLEGTRPQVLANAAERAKIQESLGEKDAIQGQVKSIGVDLDGVRKEKNLISSKIKQLDEEKLAVEKQINALEEELTSISEKRDNTFESIKEMRKQRDEGNSTFYQYRTIVTKAKVLAANKEIDALKELLNTEVENFMSLWNSNKAFRDDYEKRVLPSLDSRQLTRDGRIRNPNERPIFEPEIKPVADPLESEVVIKAAKKQIPEESNPISEKPKDTATSDKNKKESVKKADKGSKKTEPVEEDEEGFYVETTQKDLLPKKEDEVDEKKLIEMKKEEEILKRKQAEERKRKLAEKAAAKAAVRAQKEAEKKLKEREKKTRKKAGVATASNEEEDESLTKEEPTEETKEVEPEKKSEEKVQTLKRQDKKDGGGIKRRARGRGNDSLPKAILKRKKATNYWAWGGAIAIALLLLLVVVGYGYYNGGSVSSES